MTALWLANQTRGVVALWDNPSVFCTILHYLLKRFLSEVRGEPFPQYPITFCVPDVSDKLEFAAQKPWRYFLSLFQNLLQCKISIALIKLHKAKTSQSILGVSTSSIASIIIAIPQRIPIIPLINLITFST